MFGLVRISCGYWMIERTQRTEIEGLVATPVQWNCPLAPFTSFGIGGSADALIVIESIRELTDLLFYFSKNRIASRFIGRGTNILVADHGFKGAVLLFGKAFSGIKKVSEQDDTVRIRVGGGCSLAKLLKWCINEGYSGFEFASGIPGSVGGAVVMNAGAWGGEVADVIAAVTVYSCDEGEKQLQADALEFTYRQWQNRKTNENEERLVLSADFNLQRRTTKSIRESCLGFLEKRKGKQPRGVKNAGSFFKNPPGDSAGRLIEAAGLKGITCGDAMVSPVHANFLVNIGAARAADVQQLMEEVIRKVKETSGITLIPEVHFL